MALFTVLKPKHLNSGTPLFRRLSPGYQFSVSGAELNSMIVSPVGLSNLRADDASAQKAMDSWCKKHEGVEVAQEVPEYVHPIAHAAHLIETPDGELIDPPTGTPIDDKPMSTPGSEVTSD